MTSRLDLPLDQLAAALRPDDPPSGAYIDDLLRRIDQAEPWVQCLMTEGGRADRLRREAEAAAQQFPAPAQRPPLFSVPVGVKDIFRVDGLPTRAGSRLPPEAFAGEEAEAVRRLRRAGALILGKTVTTEFAYFAPGPTRNPRNLEHTPGGSSSGSAAAVAAGFCPLSLGTQTIGSIIRPASFCGVVGFKPTYRRIPVDGVVPLAPSLDHIGIFTRDVAGTLYAATILCDGWNPAPADLPPPVLGIPTGPYLEEADEISRGHFERVVELLAAEGFAVRNRAVMPDFAGVAANHQTILSAEAAEVHAAWFDRFGDLYHERTAQLIRAGRSVSPDELAKARDGQAVLRRELQAAMDDAGVDAWIAPSTVGPAPLGLESTGDPVMNLPWTQAGFPAITLPCGLDQAGLPLGLQIVGRFYDDERLLGWAKRVELAMGVSLGVAIYPKDRVSAGVEAGR
jgi:Asp-tRNA(Asn)/Glu-tRNA(Gln) amidotransferase A subunit family amidase